jgi:hypothetical protein
MLRARAKSRSASPADAAAYLAKANEFLRAAPRLTPASPTAPRRRGTRFTLVSPLEGRNRGGSRRSLSQGEGPGARRAPSGNFCRSRHGAEYDPRLVSATDARQAVNAAERLVRLAGRIVDAGAK